MGFVSSNILKLLSLVVALGITTYAWTLVIGTTGLDGPSVMKEQLWNTLENTYAERIIESTDGYGRAYSVRANDVWANSGGTEIKDPTSAQPNL